MDHKKNHSRGRVFILAAITLLTSFGTTGCFYSTVAGFEGPVYSPAYVAAPTYVEPVAVAPVVAPVAVPVYRPYFRPFYRPYYGGLGCGWPATSLSFSYNYVDGCW